MTNLVEKLRLAEQAAEDIYFARIDRELIAAMHRPPRVHRQQPDRTPRPTGEQPATSASNDSGDDRE